MSRTLNHAKDQFGKLVDYHPILEIASARKMTDNYAPNTNSFFTGDELDALAKCELHKRCSYAIRGVTQSIFSIARHYGGTKIQGENYTYFPESDELIRDDVLRWVTDRRKVATKSNAETKAAPQPPLFESE